MLGVETPVEVVLKGKDDLENTLGFKYTLEQPEPEPDEEEAPPPAEEEAAPPPAEEPKARIEPRLPFNLVQNRRHAGAG